MAGLGINTVRIYTPPRRDLLDEAARHGLRVMVGLPWSQHVAFLDDRAAQARRSAARSVDKVRELGGPSRGADVRARQRDPARRRPLARHACASSGSCATCTRTPRRRRPTSCSPTSTFRRPNSSISRSSTSARSTSTCTASPSCARISRGCSTSPATSRCCWPKRAPTAFAKAKTGRPRSPRCTSAPRSRKARAARSRSPGPTSGGAAAHDVDDWAFGLVDRERQPEAGGGGRGAGVRRRAVPARGSGRRGRASRSSSARTTPPTRSRTASRRSSGSTYPDFEIILVNDGSRDRTGEIGAAHPRVRVIDIPNGGLSAARNVGLAEATGEIVAYTDADMRVDPRLADVPRPAVPHLGRRRLGRTERRAGRRSADGAVHRARAGRPDARAARRSHRRARARLQHGVPARGAARDRRLQPDLPPRRRRCGRVLAAAGARLEDRLRVVGARLAPPSRVGEGVLAPAGRLRRGRDAG